MPGRAAVQATGDDQESHVEVDLQADGGGQRIDVEEAYGIGERVLDQHALGVAGDELRGGALPIVGEQDRRLLVPEVEDEELAELLARQRDGLLVHPRRAVLARRQSSSHGARRNAAIIRFQQRCGSAAQRDESDSHFLQPRKVGVGGQARVEHQVPGSAPRSFFQNSMKRKISSASSPLRRSALA